MILICTYEWCSKDVTCQRGIQDVPSFLPRGIWTVFPSSAPGISGRMPWQYFYCSRYIGDIAFDPATGEEIPVPVCRNIARPLKKLLGFSITGCPMSMAIFIQGRWSPLPSLLFFFFSSSSAREFLLRLDVCSRDVLSNWWESSRNYLFMRTGDLGFYGSTTWSRQHLSWSNVFNS